MHEVALISALRALYEGAGFRAYKMRKFEEYSLYLENRDFLLSDYVITFSDLTGRLLALKPDVTLSIVKGSRATKEAGEKLYYTESVYRLDSRTNEYREIRQMGLEALGDIDDVQTLEVCRLALETDAFDERLNLILMNALVNANKNNDAVMQYKHVSNMHQRYLGEKPPEGIREFYRKIIQAGKGLDGELEAIRAELTDYHHAKGPLVCKYGVFKEIYNLQMRALERSETIICLGLMMITGADGAELDPLQLDEAIRILLNVLSNGLRKGDTVTHYTASQYALLLPVRGPDDGVLVMERLKNQFYKQYVNSSVRLHYRIAPISSKAKVDDRRKN